MKRILWVSRHTPLPAQVRELERIFGPGTQVVQDPRPFSSAEDILSRYREGGYDDLVVVAPLSVLARLTDLGLRPLWAEMEQIEGPVRDPDREVEAAGRFYRFVRFRRVLGVEIRFGEV